MNKKRAKWTLIGCLAGLMIFGFVSTAMVTASDDKPKNKATLWSGYDEKHPWFDGKDWDWFRDMMDQPSLKPQEEGAIQNFPLDSVPRQGIEVETPESQRESQPKNPSKKTAASLAHGKFLFQTYCGACHGPHGDADTPVAEKIGAPSLVDLVGDVSESHVYNKIRYGGPVMPSYAIQTSQQDRWDIVNYIKSSQFGKGRQPL